MSTYNQTSRFEGIREEEVVDEKIGEGEDVVGAIKKKRSLGKDRTV